MFAWLGRLFSWLLPRQERPTRRVVINMDEDHLELIRWYAHGIDMTVENFVFRAAMSAVPDDYKTRWQVARADEDLENVTFELDGEFSEEAAFDASNVFPFPPRPRPRVPAHEPTFDVVVDPTLKHPCLFLSAQVPAHLRHGEAEGSCQAQGGKPCFYSTGRVRMCSHYKPKNLLVAHS